ncbi:hypothetical protein PFICI_03367 [Pestalotiopsis fici W106-1]|uniref:Uncharacterized protein n=1 Tax=Pestalotiopsis fici (strain W106-1 / CGMCC3.15140) TaxID=1229662 RepID=W3XIT4_PESFW|nr:uncharacterized protein PFICI_03367 [Pestalotiopsis fici W106-1]ETS85342.1 hypothetical protein PFICI_03367 [Pestalotiopsis fici W106-1]
MSSGIKILLDPIEKAATNSNKDEDAVDIVAIHGIGADPDNTWTGRGLDEEKINWLTHSSMLPKAVPNARIMRFGYESGWYGTAKDQPKQTYISDVAEMLLKQLELHRRDTTRPIIFIAHSYGGLVLMQALRSSFENSNKWSNFFRRTAGLIFFGTPFRGRRGLSLDQIVKAVAQYNPDFEIYPETMALSVEANPYLQHIVDRYTETRRGQHPIPLWCFYETKPSPISKTLRNNDLKDGYLVPKESACLDISKGIERHPLERHHYNLQQFPGPSDPGYQAVEDAIVRLVKDAKKYLRESSVGSKQSHLMVPFGRNETFVGRNAILDALVERLTPDTHPHDCQRTALEGLGGVGKTQIALEAAYRMHVANPDCSVFWVPAIDSTSFYKAYHDIGQVLGAKGLDDKDADVRALVHVELAREDAGPWLWIVDNADDPELLFGKQGILKLPFNRNGSILITTRNHDVAMQLDIQWPHLWIVGAMYRAESSELLSQGLGKNQVQDTTSTDALLDFLTDLPLAVKQASAYMAKTRVSTTRYLAHCESSDETLIKLLSKDFGDRSRYDAAQNPVATTWLISFEHIKRDTPLAADYLRFISFLSMKNIPRSLLPGEDELETDDALGTLKSYAFIDERIDASRFDIHRLVQLAMRNQLAKDGEQVAWRTRVMKRVDEIYLHPKHENKKVWIDYLPHAQAVLEICAEATDESTESHLLSKVGESSSLLGEYAAAETMHRKAYKLSKKLQGISHPDTLATINDIAEALYHQGQYPEATIMHRKTLELRTEILGAEHLDTLVSMGNLAQVLFKEARYTEAQTLSEEALKMRTKILGADDPETLRSMNNLALILGRQGRYKDAEAMLRRAFELRTRVLGAEHPDTLVSMNDLASTLAAQGRFQEAQEIHEREFELSTKVLGAEHPDTVISMNNVAMSLAAQGRWLEAEAMLRRTLDLRVKVAPEHPDTLVAMSNVGRSLNGQCRDAEAEAIHRRTHELRTKVLGADHPDTIVSLRNIAMSLAAQDKWQEAEVMYRTTLALRVKVLGADHPETRDSEQDLTNMLQKISPAKIPPPSC